MPIVKDKNGNYVVSGKIEDTTPYVPEQPPKPVAKPQKPQKPWWQQALNNLNYEAKRATNNLSYEAKRIQKDPLGAAVTYGTNVKKAGLAGLELQPQFGVPKAIERSVTSGGVVNDLKYEVGQLRNPARGVGRLTTLASNALLPKFAADELALGAIQATGNIARNAADLGPGDYTQKGFGGIDDAVDEAYRANARKPPSEMTDDEKNIDDTRASVALQGALTAGTMGLAPMLQGLRFVGPAFQALDPGKAKTVLGIASRFLASQGLEELPATFLDDNTQGSILGLFGPDADPVKPGMTRFEAGSAAFLPNLAVAGGLSAPFILGQLRNIKRAKTSESVRSRRQQARNSQKEAGLIQEDPDTGKTAFTEETLQAKPVETPKPGPTYEEAEAGLLEKYGLNDQTATATAEPAVKTEPAEAVDPFEQQYDPETPESDALGEALGEADDDQLLLINQANDGIPQLVEETLTRPGPGYNPDAQLDLVGAPKDSLAAGATAWSDRLGSVPTDTLLSLASNSDELASKITELTGKELAEFGRLDVINGLRALEGDGTAVMPNRLMGAPLMAISDIEVDPARFQFKQGTDAQGQQKGNSLTGVGRWNPDMEGVIQVWTDPMNGKTYVVNGHNRLAKARELGVPSVRIEQLDAPTAELARAQGALTNIAQGGGTGFDAAKFFRESGITDPSQLEGLGVPMKSGLAVEGIALAKLPDNIFQDAIDGKITKGKAMALGGGGLDEAGMQAAYKALQGRDMSDATFYEVVQQAKSAPTTAGSQVDLFGDTETLNLMVEKGQLAAAIRAELQKDKSLFARVGKNAGRLEAGGNQIDAVGSQQVAMDAAMVMARFDAEKYANTPLGQLLNEGALQIAEGGKVKPVADRIRRVYGKELEANPPTAKAEEALAAAEPAAPAQQVPAAAAPAIEIPEAAGRKITAKTPEGRITSAARSLAGWTRVPGKDPMPLEQALQLVRAKGAILDPDAVPGLNADLARNDQAMGRSTAVTDGVAAAYRQFYGVEAGPRPAAAAAALTQPTAAVGPGRWESWSPEKQTEKAVEAQGLVLSDRVLANRQKYKADSDANAAAVSQYLDDSPGSNSGKELTEEQFVAKYGVDESQHPQLMHKGGATPKQLKDLENHNWAQEYLAWYKQNAEVRPELKPEERQALINEIVSKAARNGEVRPPSTPLLETPRESGVSMEKVARDLEEGVLSDDVVKAIDDELRLAEEHKRLDDAMEADRVAAEREAIGYEDMTFDEKKGNGLLDGIAPDPRKAAIQDMLADAEAKGDTTLAREMKNALARLEKKGNGIRMGYYDNFDGDAVTRRQIEAFSAQTKTQSLSNLLLHAEQIYKNAGKTLAGSEALATEAAIAMRDAALIAGVTPDRIKYMDSIDLVGIFGVDAAAGSMDAWNPRFADFMRNNPTDPLTSDLGSLSIGGVRVPEDAHYGNHRAAIYLALHPALLKRLPGIGTPTAFRKTAFHEAFHSVQDWLFPREGEALMEPAALKEMEAMIKKHGGAWSKDMDAMEIQAEAFGVWANNRKLKFENKGIQALFERTKQFINSLNQKLRYILKKDPTYVDVFELAYRGDVGRRKYITELTDQQLQGLAKNLDDQMARNIPELTSRIHDYAVAKLDEADRRIQDWENRNNKEGC